MPGHGAPTQGATQTGETELQEGIQLTKAGRFAEAIPYFLAARGNTANEFAVEFNLALSYMGARRFAEAILVLRPLEEKNKENVSVENLLAQALIGNSKKEEGWEAFERAAKLTPQNEKLYALVGDACADQQEFALGLRVAEVGLKNLPNSPRLRYERGYFLALLDRVDEAKVEFERTSELAPGSEIAAVAAAQESYFAGDPGGVTRVGRKAVQEGKANYIVLTALGDALLRLGAVPGQPEFVEAEGALRRAIEEKPSYASARIALGTLLVANQQLDEAIAHLEKGRDLDRRNPRVYALLGSAYRRRGEAKKANEMFEILARLNAEEAARISSAPGDQKAIP
jgi:tetratricopeptide (TPR) repeat protein